MGYDTHIVLGNLCSPCPEMVRDTEKPFEDGSGFPHKRDEEGRSIPTGRVKHYFMPAVSIKLGKIYHTSLEEVHTKYKELARKKLTGEYVYFYHSNGNTEFSEDSYGDPLAAVPFNVVREAVLEDIKKNRIYRQFHWLAGLLEAMSEEAGEMSCLLYGS